MKKFKLVDSEPDNPDQSAARHLDWNLCIFRQNDTGESLQCPNATKRAHVGAGYKSLADSLVQFQEIGTLPLSVSISELDEGNGSADALWQHNARWHKSCRNLYNKTKLNRALKRKSTVTDPTECNSTDESAEDVSSTLHAKPDVGISPRHYSWLWSPQRTNGLIVLSRSYQVTIQLSMCNR